MIPDNIKAHIDGLLKDADAYATLAIQCRKAAAILSETFGSPDTTSQAHAHPNGVMASEPPRDTRSTFVLSPAQTKTRADFLEEIFKEIGRAKTPALVAHLRERGQEGPKDEQVYISSVNNTLNRNRNTRFVKFEDGSWDLVDAGSRKPSHNAGE